MAFLKRKVHFHKVVRVLRITWKLLSKYKGNISEGGVLTELPHMGQKLGEKLK